MKEDLSTRFVEERREIIYSVIAKNNRVTNAELSAGYNLNEATVRRDLTELEKRGLIKRTHGGAILANKNLEEIALKVRQYSRVEEKKRIAAAAAQFVSDGDALFVDGGSTTLEIAKALKTKNNLVIVTNSISFALEFSGANSNQVILTGGELRTDTNVLVGPVAIETLRQFRPDHVILGMSSLQLDEGFFTVNQHEAQVKRTMLASGKNSIVVMDSSKIGKCMFSFVCDFSMVDHLVVDDGITKEAAVSLENKGIQVTVVSARAAES